MPRLSDLAPEYSAFQRSRALKQQADLAQMGLLQRMQEAQEARKLRETLAQQADLRQRELAGQQMEMRRDLAGQQDARQRELTQMRLQLQGQFNEARLAQQTANAEMMHQFRMSQARTDADRTAETARHNKAMEEIRAFQAGTKGREKEQQLEKGKKQVSDMLGVLNNEYRDLQKRGAIADTTKSTAYNVARSIASSTPGQIAGRVVGSETQAIRNRINMTRPLLMNAIRQATGLSARALDSNIELQFYLQAATNPAIEIQSNLAALSHLDKLYGLGIGIEVDPRAVDALKNAAPKTQATTPPSPQAPSGIRIMDIQTKDGILLRGIPEGTSDEAIKERINKIRKERASVPSGFEKEARETLGVTLPELIAGSAPVRFALGAASPILGAAELGARALGDKGGSEATRRIEEMKQAGMKAYGQEGTDVIGIGGTVMSPAALAAMKYIAPAATAGGRILQGAGFGAGFGASAPVGQEEGYAATKAAQTGLGAGLGLAIPAGIEGVRALARGGRNLIDPLLPGGNDRLVGRKLREAAGEKYDDVVKWLRENSEIVPGSRPTAAEAAAPAGSAEFSAMQKIAEARRPTRFTDIASSQEAARLAAIRNFGRDQPALEAAEAARSAAAKTDYGAAYEKLIRADPELAGIASDPYFKRALPAAIDLAKSKGVDVKQNLTQFLHYVKLGLDDQLSGQSREAIAASEKQAVQGVKTRLLDWMARHNKPYDIARLNFAKASKPIDEMRIGQELERALTSPMGTAERPVVFATAMREGPRTIKKATGEPRYESLEEALQPQNVEAAKSVLSDLARQSRHEQLAKAGSAAAVEIAGQARLPAAGMFNPKYSVARAILNRLLGKIEGRAWDRLVEAMEDPAIAERLMTMTAGQRVAFISGVTGEKVSPALVIGTTSAAVRAEPP